MDQDTFGALRALWDAGLIEKNDVVVTRAGRDWIAADRAVWRPSPPRVAR
jgi:hypothetical protein